jgi:hypothetical protein
MHKSIVQSWEVIGIDQIEPGNKFRVDSEHPPMVAKAVNSVQDVTCIETEEGIKVTKPSHYQFEYLESRVVTRPGPRWWWNIRRFLGLVK